MACIRSGEWDVWCENLSETDSFHTGVERNLIHPDLDYLVGVSGGRDSVVLLHWLASVGVNRMLVCHFNHSLRGEDSDRDEQFVRELAGELECEFLSEKSDSLIFAETSRQSLETAARECRYRFFSGVARERSCQRLILAHHADDQVETVLMNLFRGSGIKGLAGMEPVSHREIDGTTLEIIRPFLNVNRETLEEYRKNRGLTFREDATNSELIATRNRVRHELIPLAADIFSRDTSQSILRLSEIARMEYAASELTARRWLDSHQLPDGALPLAPLRLLTPAEMSNVVFFWLKTQRVKNCGFQEVKRIIEMVQSNDRPAKINLSGARYARRRAGKVFVTADR